MNNYIEILAPCGSADSVTAAVRSGANAVYIGLQSFSARAYADNFGGDVLRECVRYCHLHGVSVHVALNTLVSDEEITAALDAAKEAYQAGVDAFIIQDWGLAQLVKKACPKAEIHASTQMSVHTPEAAKFLYENGFDRVVLAREMSREEIVEVVNSCPVNTEVFVHGALCMCVSGQCYLSAMIGGRSGNRGRCAQPCRLPFAVKNGTGHDLSLKDNSIIDKLADLADIGVTSAKIEGRMKRPEYVSAAVRASRKSLEQGHADKKAIDDLRSVFSRSGFTDGYYEGRLGKEMFGTRTKEDVTAANNALLTAIRTSYKDEVQTNPVDFEFTLKSGERASLTAGTTNGIAAAVGSEPQKAVKVPLSAEKVEAQLRKTGGTAFYTRSVKVNIEDGLTLPVSEINSLRRSCLEQLSEGLSAVQSREDIQVSMPAPKAHRRHGGMKLRANFKSCDISDSFKSCELVFVPLYSKKDDIKALADRGFNVGVRVPRVIFGKEKEVTRLLESMRELGIEHVKCGNIGTAALAVRLGFKVHGEFSLNVFNTESLKFIENMGLVDTEVSIELTAHQINSLGGTLPRGIAGYGHLPLMITRNCPNKNGDGCAKCGGRSIITDRKGIDFTLMCEGGCTELLNGDPLVLSDKQSDFIGADFITLSFTYESKEECERILRFYEQERKPSGKLTRGLYYRSVI